MLHFLLSNLTDGNDAAFFKMMKDFVDRHRDEFASTDDFRTVANEYFAKTQIAQRCEVKIKLPKRPQKVEFDPSHWILSEKTSTNSR
jgi:hypothetical protein